MFCYVNTYHSSCQTFTRLGWLDSARTDLLVLRGTTFDISSLIITFSLVFIYKQRVCMWIVCLIKGHLVPLFWESCWFDSKWSLLLLLYRLLRLARIMKKSYFHWCYWYTFGAIQFMRLGYNSGNVIKWKSPWKDEFPAFIVSDTLGSFTIKQ